MTRASSDLQRRQPFAKRRFWRSGFSLVEVVVATGLCTYALVVIACLLPMGLGTVQSANAQIVETDIFNKIWLEVNTTPFYALSDYFRIKGGTPVGSTPFTGGALGLSYFDKDGGELPIASAASAVYIVNCSLLSSATASLPSTMSASRLTTAGQPPVDGLGTYSNQIPTNSAGGAGLALILIKVGFHVDPTTLGATDPRLTTRTYVIAKRDTYNGS